MLATVARAGVDEDRRLDQLMKAGAEASPPYPRMHKRYKAFRNTDAAADRAGGFETQLELILDRLERRAH